MKSLRTLSLSALAVSSFTACETTGDPTQGGIFWSETKAQQRLRDREATLDSIDADTARVRRSNRQLEGAAARRQQMLGE